MTDPLNRDDIIALLQRLGAEDDAEVLEAARALHAAVGDTAMTWDDLLIPEEPGDADAAAPEETPVPEDASGRDAEALALIDKLLARTGITEDFRDEMEGYRADVREGDFTDADHKYLVALDKRLSGKG